MENEISVYELIVIFEKARRDLLSKEFEFAHNGMTIRMVFGLNEISTLLEVLHKAKEDEESIDKAMSENTEKPDHDGCVGCRYIKQEIDMSPCNMCKHSYQSQWTQMENE